MNPSVLIIEDDVNLLELAALYLAPIFQTFLADNGADGLRLARQKRPDLIVLDMMMPGISGAEVIQALQEDAGTRKIPVVVLSAFNFSEEEAAKIKAEPNVKDLLQKPFSFEKFGKRLTAIAEAASVSADP